MSSELGPAAVAERFRDLFVSEESGTLEVRSGTRILSLQFNQGLTVGAVEAPSLPGVPAGDGASSGEDHAQAGARARDALATTGNLAAQAVADRTVQLATEVIETAFACVPDAIGFTPAPVSTGEFHGDLLRTVEAFLRGVRAMAGFEGIHEALLSIDQRLVLRPNPSVPLEHLCLKPIHGFVLSRLDGSLSFSEIALTLPPVEEAETARFVFALLLLGSVAPDPPLGAGLFRTELLLSDHIRDTAREQSEIDFIRETYTALQGQNPYQVLGVGETANAEEIQKAYKERKQAAETERFLKSVRQRMGSELRIIEARLTEAYLALHSGGMGRAPAKDSSAEGIVDFDSLTLRREVTKTEAAVSIDEAEKLAEQYYLTAKKYFGQADYHNCVQYCTLAIRHSEQTARYHLLMGEAQSRNPDHRWQKMAEQSFLKATTLDPWNADPLVLLGQFYKRQGLKVRARRQFERALELQPGHPKAREELGLAD